ncbi:GldG family protein [Brumicola pallidula]|jgi:ABC-type uncharacterized transport system involved in gliding motility auxiliary subunit|uniref:Uncharacterized protein n=1 Tax=Brumicola pallidula DSM 14239 = ACAM 615 TaxID=1121922 RepID=K6ZK60_9ALTE|nr:GldG family protein [Glaciecola pallidula]GAC30737.1 hypothetical protein GPAL_3897 [Glaciecola pallidula DSM 14239 = ACAM 615]
MSKSIFSMRSSLLVLLPFFCGLSLFVLALGVALFYIEQELSYLSTGLLICSGMVLIILLGMAITYRFNTANSRLVTIFEPKRWKKFATVMMITIASVTFIGGSNYLANSSTLRWDITKDKQHTLSANTVEFVSVLERDVQLTALYVGVPPKYLQDLFNEYERASGGVVTTEIIDPIEQVAYAATFGNVINSQEQKVIVQSGNNRKDVDFTQDSLSEERLTNAIASVSRAQKTVYFLTGHGEYSMENEQNTGLSKFTQLLAANNILSKPLMLGISQSIPDDSDVLIIAGPKNELTEEEESLIEGYLLKGGDALFLIEHTVVTTPDKPLNAAQMRQNPDLNSLLNKWGLNVESDIVVDLTSHVGDDVGSPATKNYQKHKAITEGLDYTFYVRPRSINLLENRRPNIKHAVIASTASTKNSWAESDRNLEVKFDEGIDTAGPVPFSYVVIEEKDAQSIKQGKTSDTRLIVFTDADFLTNVYIDQYSNAQMGLNIVNWLSELDYKAFLGNKKIAVERLDLTSKQKRQVIVILFLLPFTFIIAGLIIWLRIRYIV